MATDHRQWMEQAVSLAVRNVKAGSGGPFGAVVVKDNRLIASGVNQVTATHDPTAHAEMVAIRAACTYLQSFQLTDCDLYTSCEPCPMCLGAIYWARPRSYYFACTRESAAQAGFDDSYIYDQIHLRPDQRSIPGHCVQITGEMTPFVEWTESIQKIRY